jgi:hypothetical protein
MAGNNVHADPLRDEPRNPHVHHETGDVNARALTKFGLSMAFMILIFLVGLWGMFDYLKNREAELGLPLSPAAIVNAEKHPPDPQLQPHPAQDMQQWRAAEERALHQYAWKDPDKGVVQIPVERAMDLIAQRGLPVVNRPAGKTK